MLLYILLLNLKTSDNLHIGNVVSKMKDERREMVRGEGVRSKK